MDSVSKNHYIIIIGVTCFLKPLMCYLIGFDYSIKQHGIISFKLIIDFSIWALIYFIITLAYDKVKKSN